MRRRPRPSHSRDWSSAIKAVVQSSVLPKVLEVLKAMQTETDVDELSKSLTDYTLNLACG